MNINIDKLKILGDIVRLTNGMGVVKFGDLYYVVCNNSISNEGYLGYSIITDDMILATNDKKIGYTLYHKNNKIEIKNFAETLVTLQEIVKENVKDVKFIGENNLGIYMTKHYINDKNAIVIGISDSDVVRFYTVYNGTTGKKLYGFDSGRRVNHKAVYKTNNYSNKYIPLGWCNDSLFLKKKFVELNKWDYSIDEFHGYWILIDLEGNVVFKSKSPIYTSSENRFHTGDKLYEIDGNGECKEILDCKDYNADKIRCAFNDTYVLSKITDQYFENTVMVDDKIIKKCEALRAYCTDGQMILVIKSINGDKFVYSNKFKTLNRIENETEIMGEDHNKYVSIIDCNGTEYVYNCNEKRTY